MMRMAMTLRLEPALDEQLTERARRDGVSKQKAAEAAIAAYVTGRPERLQEAIAHVVSRDAGILARLAE